VMLAADIHAHTYKMAEYYFSSCAYDSSSLNFERFSAAALIALKGTQMH
jgi:hypothetical protein